MEIPPWVNLFLFEGDNGNEDLLNYMRYKKGMLDGEKTAALKEQLCPKARPKNPNFY